jgi:hypothetical protein
MRAVRGRRRVESAQRLAYTEIERAKERAHLLEEVACGGRGRAVVGNDHGDERERGGVVQIKECGGNVNKGVWEAEGERRELGTCRRRRV